MSRHRDDRDAFAGTGFLLANASGRLDPVHHRHLQVHQDQVERFCLNPSHSDRTVIGNDHLVTPTVQQPDGQFLIGQSVFDQQDFQDAFDGLLGVHRRKIGLVLAGHGRQQGIEQLGLFDRFHQVRRNFQLFAPLRVFRAGTRCQHDHIGFANRVVRPQFLDHFEAVLFRHVNIGQHDRERPPVPFSISQELERFVRRGSRRGVHPPSTDQLGEDPSVGVVVVNDQDGHPDNPLRMSRRDGRTAVATTQREREEKSAPVADLAFDLYLPTHQSDQVGRDRQPQPGAAKTTRCRCVDLSESVKDGFAFLFGYTDPGVPDFKAKLDQVVVPAHGIDRNDHFAAFGEFDRVANQVDDDLP